MNVVLSPGRLRRIAPVVMGVLLAASASGAVAPLSWNLHLWRRLGTEHREAPQTSQDRFFRGITSSVPSHGVICLQPAAVPGGFDRLYYSMQYALAPRVLDLSAGCEFTMVYGTSASSFSGDPSLQLVRSLGDEIRLFRRRSQ